MGILDSLYVNLKCPETSIENKIEIQFKWADPSMRIFKIGSKLEPAPEGNAWIPELYFCNKCKISEEIAEGGPLGFQIIKTQHDFEGAHTVFMYLSDGVFKEVLHSEEFFSRYGRNGELKLPEGERICHPWLRYTW